MASFVIGLIIGAGMAVAIIYLFILGPHTTNTGIRFTSDFKYVADPYLSDRRKLEKYNWVIVDCSMVKTEDTNA